MAKALGIGHFRSPPRPSLHDLPGMNKLSARLAEACRAGLAAIGQGPWRVTAEGLSTSPAEQPLGDQALLRLESALGSLTLQLALDRQAVSALLEAAMGGTGTEAVFEPGERPLSKIERGILALARGAIGAEIAVALGEHWEREFRLLEGSDFPELAAQDSRLAQFQFVVNLFSYGGDLRLTVAADELERQFTSAGPIQDADDAATKRERLQTEVGRSDLTLTVTLGPELLPLEAMSGWEAGRLVALTATAASPVTVWSGGVAIYEGQLARQGDRLAVTLTAALT